MLAESDIWAMTTVHGREKAHRARGKAARRRPISEHISKTEAGSLSLSGIEKALGDSEGLWYN